MLEWEKSQREPDCLHRGHVSAWVGAFPDDRAFEKYLGGEEVDSEWEADWQEISPFCQDLGLLWFNLGLQRSFNLLRFVYSARPLPIGELLRDFPRFASFREEWLDRCRILGIDVANTAICVYDLEYEGAGPFAFGRLRFRFSDDRGGRFMSGQSSARPWVVVSGLLV